MNKKKLGQIPTILENALKEVSEDSDLGELGFDCEGQLCQYEAYSNFFEKLWVWATVEKDEVYIVVTADHGNGYCGVVYTNLYIPEIIDDINKYVEEEENNHDKSNSTNQ